jgi:hypothetical protein
MLTAAKPSEKETGWVEAFDRIEPETNKPEKPVHVLNARQVEYNAHIKRMMAEQKANK